MNDFPGYLYANKRPSNEQASSRKTSQRVAETFCAAYARQFSVTAEVVDHETDESLDAVIKIGGVEIALELTGYWQQGAELEQERDDQRVKDAIGKAFVAGKLWFSYVKTRWHKRPNKPKNNTPAMRYTIPGGQNLKPFVKELADLAKWADETGRATDSSPLRPESSETIKRWQKLGPHEDISDKDFFDKEQFKIIARYCESIALKKSDPECTVYLVSSLDVRAVGLDKPELTRVVEKKHKNLPNYRNRAAKRQGSKPMPVWLVVYCDGHLMSASMPKEQHEDAMKTIGEVAKGAPDTFDKVWWAENTAWPKDATVFAVR